MYRTESGKTCDQTGFGWFVMYGMYRMLQACLELVDGKGGLLSLLTTRSVSRPRRPTRSSYSASSRALLRLGAREGAVHGASERKAMVIATDAFLSPALVEMQNA